jgi:hypothetical protein
MADVAQPDRERAEAAKKATEANTEATKKRLADERAAREKAQNERIAEQVKPTPTQDENDLVASGVYLAEHEADGSQEQPPGADPKKHEQHKLGTEHREARPAAGSTHSSYSTRTTKPQE